MYQLLVEGITVFEGKTYDECVDYAINEGYATWTPTTGWTLAVDMGIIPLF